MSSSLSWTSNISHRADVFTAMMAATPDSSARTTKIIPAHVLRCHYPNDLQVLYNLPTVANQVMGSEIIQRSQISSETQRQILDYECLF